MNKVLYLFMSIFLFSVGAYYWKINNTGYKQTLDAKSFEAGPILEDHSVIVEIAGSRLTTDDLDWEYKLHTNGVVDARKLTPIPDLGTKYDQELQPLKKSLISSMIERKLLFTFIQQDKAFDLNDPARYTDCLQKWQANIQARTPLLSSDANRDRLKARLCERSILDQYMTEKLFSTIQVTENEITEYYKNNFNDFKNPERVTIRQIVLPNEQDAKRARSRLASGNFASLARQLSITPEAENGGLLGPFAKGEMPEFFDVAFKMKEGQISDILKSNYGFHLIMLVRRQAAADLSLARATPRIVEILKNRKQIDAYQKWVERALAQVSVTSPKPLW